MLKAARVVCQRDLQELGIFDRLGFGVCMEIRFGCSLVVAVSVERQLLIDEDCDQQGEAEGRH